MGKYDPLFRYLNASRNTQVTLRYSEIENILSANFPILLTSIKNGGTTIPMYKASLGLMRDIKSIPYFYVTR